MQNWQAELAKIFQECFHSIQASMTTELLNLFSDEGHVTMDMWSPADQNISQLESHSFDTFPLYSSSDGSHVRSSLQGNQSTKVELELQTANSRAGKAESFGPPDLDELYGSDDETSLWPEDNVPASVSDVTQVDYLLSHVPNSPSIRMPVVNGLPGQPTATCQ